MNIAEQTIVGRIPLDEQTVLLRALRSIAKAAPTPSSASTATRPSATSAGPS